MGINLSKGGNINLSKEDPSLTAVTIGLGWDVRNTDGKDFDLDAMALLLNASDKAMSDADLVFYNNLKHISGSVEHTGDNRTGQGDGDDEAIKINLATVPTQVDKVRFSVSIHEGRQRGQSFGQVMNAFIRVVNAATGTELARYDLTEDASVETCMIFGELYRHNGDWKFRAVGQGYKDGLEAFLSSHGFGV